MRNLKLWISSVPAPRKWVLPVSDPVSATDRFEQVVAERFQRNQKEMRDDGRPAYARLCLRVGPPEVHAFGRGMAAAGDGSTPVLKESLLQKPRGW